MSATESYDVEACLDCLYVFMAPHLASEQLTDEQEAALLSRFDDMWGREAFTVDISPEDPWFSNQPCEVCGDKMAGKRYGATVMSRA